MSRAEFDQLIQQLSRKLYGFAFRILRNQEEAEDAVQEVFIKLWNMRRKLEDYRSIDALAVAVARNHCIDLIRRKKHLFEGKFPLSDLQQPAFPSPHEQMENTESGEILNKIIRDLPENYRTVIQMRDVEGISYEEIAGITDQNINTLRVTLSRARSMIRDEYNKYQHERGRYKKAD